MVLRRLVAQRQGLVDSSGQGRESGTGWCTWLSRMVDVCGAFARDARALLFEPTTTRLSGLRLRFNTRIMFVCWSPAARRAKSLHACAAVARAVPDEWSGCAGGQVPIVCAHQVCRDPGPWRSVRHLPAQYLVLHLRRVMAAAAAAVPEFLARCAEAQRGSDAANKWLVDFRAQPQALEVAKQVVRTSTMQLACCTGLMAPIGADPGRRCFCRVGRRSSWGTLLCACTGVCLSWALLLPRGFAFGTPCCTRRVRAVHSHCVPLLATESSADMVAQFHATQVISDVVVRRWDALPLAERQGVRNYILGLVFERWAQCVPS